MHILAVRLNATFLKDFVGENELINIAPQVKAANDMLNNKTGAGNDFLGWVELPKNYDKEEFLRIKAAAEKIRKSCDILIVIGIGGSYLGARAVIELLNSQFCNLKKSDSPQVLFAGNSLSPAYLNELLAICKDKDICVNVISKSGTTTEPAIAFRVFRDLLTKKYGDSAKERIFATTDKARGALKALADSEGYETFVIPDDVGGRYSVLTPVGLLPAAVAGIDIDALMEGAAAAMVDLKGDDNDCCRYAAIRNILLRKGKTVELLTCFEPSFQMMGEWFKQLYGESEGKDNRGIFPSSAIFSTDLHSLGQYIQDGMRNMFETVVDIGAPQSDFVIGESDTDDGLDFVTGMSLSEVCKKAMQGTVLAHTDGGVPNMILEIPEINAYEVGYLIYFFEKACAVSGYILGVNPFDQPGVESYKKNMFALLGKSGFEEQRALIEQRLCQ